MSELYIVIKQSDSHSLSNLPIAIFDSYDQAQKYVYAYPCQHLIIYKYLINETNDNPVKLLDSYYLHRLF